MVGLITMTSVEIPEMNRTLALSSFYPPEPHAETKKNHFTDHWMVPQINMLSFKECTYII